MAKSGVSLDDLQSRINNLQLRTTAFPPAKPTSLNPTAATKKPTFAPFAFDTKKPMPGGFSSSLNDGNATRKTHQKRPSKF